MKEGLTGDAYAWTGTIPSHWRHVRLGSCFRQRNITTTAEQRAPLSVAKVGVVEQQDQVAQSQKGAPKNLVMPGDLVINSRSDRKGSAGLAPRTGSVSLINTVLEPTGINPNFAHHLIRSSAFQEEFFRHGSGIVDDLWTTRYSAMKNIQLPLPPEPEQSAIADYLDHETAEIDAFIADQSLFIQRWDERVQAQMDLKFEQFHEHAELRRILTYITSGSRGWGDFVGDVGQPFVRIANLQRNDIEANLADLKRVSGVENAEGNRSRITLDDLLISITADLGSVAVADRTLVGGYTSQHICLARLDTAQAIPRFIAYSLLTSRLRASVRTKSYGGTKIQLALSDVKELRVPLPPVKSQLWVAEDCQRILAESADLKHHAEQAMDLAHERRAALISAAVTGQIDVTKRHKPVAEVLEDEVREMV